MILNFFSHAKLFSPHLDDGPGVARSCSAGRPKCKFGVRVLLLYSNISLQHFFVIVLSLHLIFLPPIRFFHPSPSPRKERKGWSQGPYSIWHPRNKKGVELFLFKKLLWFLFCLIAWLWKSQKLRIHFFERWLSLKVAVAFCLNLCSGVPSLTDMFNLFCN